MLVERALDRAVCFVGELGIAAQLRCSTPDPGWCLNGSFAPLSTASRSRIDWHQRSMLCSNKSSSMEICVGVAELEFWAYGGSARVAQPAIPVCCGGSSPIRAFNMGGDPCTASPPALARQTMTMPGNLVHAASARAERSSTELRRLAYV